MLKGILQNLLLSVLLIFSHSLYANSDYFWLLQEYGIEKRAMSDGALIQNFTPLTKPLAFSVKPKQSGIWAIADGFLISFDKEGTITNSAALKSINQNAYLVSMPENGVWLLHGDKRYTYNEQLELVETLDLPLKGNQINDVAYDQKHNKTWITTANSVIDIDNESAITLFELEKNEKLNGITTSQEGEVALIVATPKPEFRLYTSDFEHIITHQLDNVSPAPNNLAETKDGQYWLAGKQHIILIDKDNGIEVNYEHNGELGQGPGEIQLIVNPINSATWVSLGHNLTHISTTGNKIHQSEQLVKLIDIKNNSLNLTPPIITLQNQATSCESRHRIFDVHGTFYTYFPLNVYKCAFPFSFEISDSNNDVDYSSLRVSTSTSRTTLDITNQGDFQNIDNDRVTCRRSSVSTGVDNVFCAYYAYDTNTEREQQIDENITAELQITDHEGSTSNIANINIFIDRTPPNINENLISFSINGETATIIGLAGSIEAGSTIGIHNTRNASTYFNGIDFFSTLESNDDGSFAATFPITYAQRPENYDNKHYIGDDIKVFAYDNYWNISPTPATFTVGHEITLEVHTPEPHQLIGPDVIISGTHDMQAGGEVTATYWTSGEEKTVQAIINGDTFTFDNIIFHDAPTTLYKKIIFEARESNDGYGQFILPLFVNTTPPPQTPTIDNIFMGWNATNLVNNKLYFAGTGLTSNTTLVVHNTSNNTTTECYIGTDGYCSSRYITAQMGDQLEIYVIDSLNRKSDTLTITAGYTIDINITQPADNTITNEETINIAGTVSSAHNSIYHVDINTVSQQTSRDFFYTNAPVTTGARIDDREFARYVITARSNDGGYGQKTFYVQIDRTAPAAINAGTLTLEFPAEGTVEVKGLENYTTEAYATVTIINTDTGHISTTQADYMGRFSSEILASHGNTLSITATDKAGNVSQPTLIDTGYIIDLQVSQPTPGAMVYSQKVVVTGTHDGPTHTAITINGAVATVNGNQFSREIEINPYTGAIEIIASGPDSGYGKTSLSVVYKVPAPVTDLIELTFNSDETITLLGKPGSAIPDGIVTIYNLARGTMKDAYVAPDGSFSTTINAVGGDTLTLIAKDKNGIEGTSATIDAGYLADIAITTPSAGAEVGPNLTVSGSHAGPLDSVITVNGIAAVITDATFTASNIPVNASGTITAKLFAADGAYGIASITVTRDTTPPAVPNLDLIDTAFSAGDSVFLNGKAGSVEAGATLTVTNTTQNISKTITVADDGSFTAYIPAVAGETLSQIATDAVGNQSESASLPLGIEAMITIDSPYEGAIIPALIPDGGSLTGLVNVTGSHAGPINSGIVVNGVVAAVTADRFVALNVPVSTDGTITAKLTALDGSHGSAQLTVGLHEHPYLLNLAPSSTEGMAPHSVSFKWNSYTADTPTEVSIDYNGDGSFDQSSSDLTTTLQHDYTAAGISNVTLRITMADGSHYTAETTVVTHGSDHYDAIFLSLWNGMNDALLANEPLVALNYLERRAQGQFHNTFHVIAPRMQAIVDSYRTPARSAMNDYYLEYIVPRARADGNLLYYIYCVREYDGSWRIKEM